MLYKFRMFGHKNISATHYTTLECTKDAEITAMGHCIIGVCADFDPEMLKRVVNTANLIKVTIRVDTSSEVLSDSFICVTNKSFASQNELVIRRGSFLSERTFGTNASKGSSDLAYDLVKRLKDPKQEVVVILEKAVE